MNILITTPIFPPQIGGPANYIWELSQKLSQHQLTIITFSNSAKKPKTSNLITIPLSQQHFLASPKRQLQLFIKILQQLPKSDLIYIQGPIVVGFTSVITSKLLSKPSIIKFVGDIAWEHARNNNQTDKSLEDFYSNPLPLQPKLINWFQEFSLQQSNHIITPSQYLKDFLIKYHNINPNKIKVIYNSVQVSKTKTKRNPKQIIFVGRLVSWKNVDQIIKAVNLARKQKDWQLKIIGDGPLRPELETHVTDLKANSWVKFLGRLPKKQVEKHIAQSAKLILLSTYEGMPHTLIEAQYLKTPVIASNITPHKEIITKTSGVLVPLNKPKLLAKAINSTTSKQDISAAFDYVTKHFTWKNHICSLNKLFQTVK